MAQPLRGRVDFVARANAVGRLGLAGDLAGMAQADDTRAVPLSPATRQAPRPPAAVDVDARPRGAAEVCPVTRRGDAAASRGQGAMGRRRRQVLPVRGVLCIAGHARPDVQGTSILAGIHPPLTHDEHFQKRDLPFTRENALSQARGVLRLVETFFETLSDIGVYRSDVDLHHRRSRHDVGAAFARDLIPRCAPGRSGARCRRRTRSACRWCC